MSELSIFVDESGDFGKYTDHAAPYYLFTLVFHDQGKTIIQYVDDLNTRLSYGGYPNHTIHVGPLIRREYNYRELTIDERRHILNCFFHFARRLPIAYKTFAYKKSDYPDAHKLIARMSADLFSFFNKYQEYFRSFDEIKLYYDNGQQELNRTLTAVFSIFPHFTYCQVKPSDYRLFQVADLICTFELIGIKQANNELSNSETQFFYKPKELKKTYLKGIQSLRFEK